VAQQAAQSCRVLGVDAGCAGSQPHPAGEKLAHQSMLIEIRLAEGYSTVMLERQPKWYENIPNAS
jgi:hypothetical protein